MNTLKIIVTDIKERKNSEENTGERNFEAHVI